MKHDNAACITGLQNLRAAAVLAGLEVQPEINTPPLPTRMHLTNSDTTTTSNKHTSPTQHLAYRSTGKQLMLRPAVSNAGTTPSAHCQQVSLLVSYTAYSVGILVIQISVHEEEKLYL
jgi:hypothetical protein